MKELHLLALKAYLDMLKLHIDTKTKDVVFHKETEVFYEKLFDVAHQIWEKYVDLGWSLEETSLNEKYFKANEIISNLRKEIENFEKNNDLTIWTQDMLWTIASDLEDIEGTSKAFLK